MNFLKGVRIPEAAGVLMPGSESSSESSLFSVDGQVTVALMNPTGGEVSENVLEAFSDTSC